MAAYKYCTAEQVKTWAVPEADITDTDTLAKINSLIEAVSANVDKFCKRPDAYFVPSTTASERRVRGEGKHYLRVGRYWGTPAFTSPVIASTSYYINAENGWIYYNDTPPNDEYLSAELGDCFFRRDAIYVVSAKWGFEAVPADVAMSTALIVGKIWDNGQGVMGQITPAGFVIERDYPPLAKTMLQAWKRREFEIN